MIPFFKRLRGKKSHSCTEDLEMEDKDVERVGSNQTSFPSRVDDHQSSVSFAQDLKKRSEATSTVNLFESLNILLLGKRKMEEYKDEQEKECDSTTAPVRHFQKSRQKGTVWNNVFEDNYSSKKLPEEHHYSEQLDNTHNSIPGKDETMENRRASLTHPEDGCDGKSDNKQSKGDSNCVRSSDCTKRNENASGRGTIRTQNSTGSSNGDEDEDENDENKRRRRKEEKFDDVQVIALKELEEEEGDENTGQRKGECEIMDDESNGSQESSSVNQEVSSRDQQALLVADHEVPDKDQEVPDKNQEVPDKDEEVPANQEVSARDQQVLLVADHEVPAKDPEVPEVPDENQEVPEENQEVPAKDEEVPANQEVSARDQQVLLVADHEVPAKDPEVPEVPDENQEVPEENHEVPAKDEEVPANQEVSARDQQVLLVADHEVPAKDPEVPEVPDENQEVPEENHEVPAKDEEVPANQEVSARDQQVLLVADHEVPAKDPEVPEVPDENQEVPDKNQEVPANQEVSVRDQQAALVADHEVPAKDQDFSANQKVLARDQQAPATYQEISAKDQEVPVKNAKVPTKDEKFEEKARSLAAAFRCHGEKAGVIDTCKNCICYSTHRLLDHSRKCKLRVLGGCKKCKELRDIYMHHVNNCKDDRCEITQCWSIKEYLKENNGKCAERWSYLADKSFFGDRVAHDKPRHIPQHHVAQQPVTREEIEEFLLLFKTPQNSFTGVQNQLSLPEETSIGTREQGMGDSAYVYHPRSPPDEELQSSISDAHDKSHFIGSSLFSVGVIEEESKRSESLPCPSSGIHSRGVSVRIETEEAEVYEQETYSMVNIEKDESFPRPDDVQLFHPLDEDKLHVKDGRYDENHEWRIVHEQNFLGRGAFGVVRLCTDLSSNKLFATKIIPKDKFESTELDIWASVSGHSMRCLELFGAVCVENTVIMFMEYMEGGSVENMLSYLPKNRFDEYSALYIIREVLEGLDFLHCNRIIHRDIKGGNILVNYTLTKVKLADYGAAVKLDSHEFSRQENRPPGTENFMAPEVCRSEEHSFSSDIWSAGCCLYQMLQGEPPWMQYPSVIYKVGTTQEPPPFPKCRKPTTDLLSHMFTLRAQDRPTAKELLQHPAFFEVNNPPEKPPRFNSDDEEDEENESQGDDNEQESSSEDEFFSFEDDEEEKEEEEEGSVDENEQPAEHEPSLGVSDHTELSEHNSSGNENSGERLGMGESALHGLVLGGPGHHFGSLNQPSTPPIGGQSPVLGRPGQHFGSLNQPSTPPISGQRPVLGGPGQHFGSLNQPSTPPISGQRPVLGGPGQHFGSLNQPSTPPISGQRPVLGGPGQHFGSLNQPSAPPIGGQSPVLGGPGQHFGSLNQPSAPPIGGQSPVLGGPGQHFGSLNQPSAPPIGGQSPVLGGPGQHFGSLNQPSTPPISGQRPVLGGPGQHFGSLNQPSAPPISGQSPVLGRPGQHFGSLNQPSTPPIGGQSPVLGGPGQHFGSLNQPSTPPISGQRPVLGGPSQHFGSLNQPSPPPISGQRPVLGGPGQHFGSLNQPSTPPISGQRPVLGGPSQHFGSLNQPSTPPISGQRPVLGGPGQHFGSLNQPSTPPISGQSPVLGGPGHHFGSPNRPFSSAHDRDSGTFPIDDELQRLQSDFIRMVSLEGGDVSGFIGMSGSWPTTDNDQDDVFDISSLQEDTQEREPVYYPRRTYSLQDLSRVELYDANGELLFTVREKTSCTFGHLAENLRSMIQEKSQALQCFTFTFKEAGDASINPNQELGFQDHMIVVLPAGGEDQWTGWRIDDRGIVELQD